MIPETILVTGGAGFIGSHTVDLLLAQDKQVLVLDNLSSGKLANLNLQHPNLEFIEGDVLEYFLVEDLIKQCDAVLHLAAIASVSATIANPLYSLQVNTLGFVHVLEAIRKVNPAIPVVFASSAAVYGDDDNLPCRESSALNQALSPYSLQKIQCEEYADLYYRTYGIQYLALRYFNVYGTRQDPSSPYSGVISKFIQAYQQDTPLIIFGDGTQSRDFIHISDVATANVLALEGKYVGALNIATEKAQTLLELIECIQAPDKPPTVSYQAKRPGDIYSSYGRAKLAQEKLGFRAQVSLAEGIRELLQVCI